MNTNMFIQNIEHSSIEVSRKYANFVFFFFSWDEEYVPVKINKFVKQNTQTSNKWYKQTLQT